MRLSTESDAQGERGLLSEKTRARNAVISLATFLSPRSVSTAAVRSGSCKAGRSIEPELFYLLGDLVCMLGSFDLCPDVAYYT